MSTASVPQSEPISEKQVRNNAGGFVYQIDDLQRLKRFLCLGCEGGTYYQGEKELGLENAQSIIRLIAAGRGVEVVETIKTFSIEGRTSKQNPIMFGLALCAKSDHLPTKQAAYASLGEVCRIPTHLFMFIKYAHALGQNWGRAQRRAVSNWYLNQNPTKLAMAVTKYQNREGYTHRDILRLSHPSTKDPLLCFLFDYITHGWTKALENLNKPKETTEGETMETAEASASVSVEGHASNAAGVDADDEDTDVKLVSIEKLKEFLETVENMKKSTDANELATAIRQQGLVREHMPTTMLRSTTIWSALLEKMPLTAMIRNLGKMSEINLLADGSEAVQQVVSRLKNREQLQRARIHPFNVLVALETYKSGRGLKGSLTWPVNEQVKKALEEAFYLSFKFVKPTNKRYLIGLDVSGSMGGARILGSPTITAAVGSCAMCMVTLRTEPYAKVMAFSSHFVDPQITREDTLEVVMEKTRKISFGSTDCALPMLWALEKNEEFDVFIVYTDNETWCGQTHPTAALKQYREKMKKPSAKLIVVGMSATQFSIADPEDPNMLDIAGFDSAAPQIISLFAEGQI